MVVGLGRGPSLVGGITSHFVVDIMETIVRMVFVEESSFTIEKVTDLLLSLTQT